MKPFPSLGALPLDRLARAPDVGIAIAVALVAAMLIVPVPTVVIDVLIPINIAVSLLVLLCALFARNALELSTFPSLLLFTTLLRLGLNVSVTRGILTRADAGEMVKAFGAFVVQGDVVVGLVMFSVVTLVQFLVIAKGAERVAEVGARFTLDALPGKQMSIEAALRAGAITEAEADERREDLGRASALFGSMDGAMKFVKGDAVAALIITALNIIAGVAIGVTRLEMSLADALRTYAVLTIGDGLVAQIAALLVTLSAGVMVTRVESKDRTKNLGHGLKDELLGSPKALGVGGALMVVLAVVPGLPALPFLALGALSGAAAALGLRRAASAGLPDSPMEAALARQAAGAKAQRAVSDDIAPSVVPIAIDLGTGLSESLGFRLDGDGDDAVPLVAELIPQLRDALYLETGVRIPGVRVRPFVTSLPDTTFAVRIDDVPVLQERIAPDACLATTHPDNLARLGVESRRFDHPISSATMALVRVDQRAVVEAAGIPLWDAGGMVALFLAGVLRRRAKDFLGLQDVSELVRRLERAYPDLVREVIPKVVGVPQLLSVLRRLVDEGVSIRNLRGIVEALGEHGQHDGDTLVLTERVRAALGQQIAFSFAGLGSALPVILIDPAIEDAIRGGLVDSVEGTSLSISPEMCADIRTAVIDSLRPILTVGKRPVLLTQTEIRRFVRKIIEIDLPSVAVLSFEELPAELTVQPMGRAALGDAT